MNPNRTRLAILLFLLALTLIVLARVATSADAATLPLSLRLLEPPRLLSGGTRLQRTVALSGAGTGPVSIGWEARVDGKIAASGEQIVAAKGGAASAVLSIPLPTVESPAGLDLRLEARGAGSMTEAMFPFLVYPPAAATDLAARLSASRIALYDPRGEAAGPLAALGVTPARADGQADLEKFDGDLIVVGPGGFGRGSEAIGSALASRVRGGMRLLLLDQATLAGTISPDLRLWPAFTRTSETRTVSSSRHPALHGVTMSATSTRQVSGVPGATGTAVRPFLPPTRGNFRIISEDRVPDGPAWREGVTMLEMHLGRGTVIASQASLCGSFADDPAARLVLANTLAYLVSNRDPGVSAALYGDGDDLPACVARLSPEVPRVAVGLAGVHLLLASGDWRAQRLASAAGVPPPTDVARYLREGGTMVLFDPQALARDYLAALTDAAVSFERADRDTAVVSIPLFEGIPPEDVPVLARAESSSFRLRSRADGPAVQPIALTPGLAVYRIGSGTLVAWSTPGADECARPRVSSLTARLLTNLGVPLANAPAAASTDTDEE